MPFKCLRPRWNKATLQHFSLQLLLGMLGADLLLMLLHVISPPSKPIVTVDVATIIQRFVKAEADTKLPPEQLKAHVNTFGKALDETLKTTASDGKLVLLPKEAVIAGAKDITPDIQKKLDAQLGTVEQKTS